MVTWLKGAIKTQTVIIFTMIQHTVGGERDKDDREKNDYTDYEDICIHERATDSCIVPNIQTRNRAKRNIVQDIYRKNS